MRKTIAVSLILSLLLLLTPACPVSADETHSASKNKSTSSSSDIEDRGAGYLPYSDPAPLGSGGLFGAVVRTIFSLAVVLGLLYATLWLIKRFTGSSMGPFSEGPVRVVGRLYLSPKVGLYFLRLVDELLVIGTSAGGISLLTTIKDERAIIQIENALRSTRTHVPELAFSRFFDKSLTRFQKALEKEDSAFDDQLRVLNEQIGRLRGLTRKKQRDED
ncbi:MAG: FliO/MopB family protein [Candidatus Hydrogenedentota bacterium]|nr:MAG: FliO/MopB family protein [Candidatus Hydrogenedentota bacterium]